MRDIKFLIDRVRNAVQLDVYTVIAGFPRCLAALEDAESSYLIGQKAGRRRTLTSSSRSFTVLYFRYGGVG